MVAFWPGVQWRLLSCCLLRLLERSLHRAHLRIVNHSRVRADLRPLCTRWLVLLATHRRLCWALARSPLRSIVAEAIRMVVLAPLETDLAVTLGERILKLRILRPVRPLFRTHFV